MFSFIRRRSPSIDNTLNMRGLLVFAVRGRP
jgi:hypothetical protein